MQLLFISKALEGFENIFLEEIYVQMISWQHYLPVSPTDTKERVSNGFSRPGKKVTKIGFGMRAGWVF